MNASILILAVVQVLFAGVVSFYFFNLMRTQQGNRSTIDRDSVREMEKLRRSRAISLSEPLSERTRPITLHDIVGQQEGLKALRAALCGPNPQHVIIYGPPGVGKTAAARVVLDEAKNTSGSPFARDAIFCEIDATTARFDERGIADPLIGSVHDPIYQGAGAMGIAGIPQPKPGAVTKAHGGVLFIDEIGELHPIQMNKLLKVLEDRRVFFESAYYSSEDRNIPVHIHDIFENGLPADFRLVGATTRSPEEISPAIRSRCLEIFFRPLSVDEIGVIVKRAAQKIHLPIADAAVELVTRHATNGREAVNIVQLAAGGVIMENRAMIDQSDVDWVIESSRLSPRPDRKVPDHPQIGVVNGLAVYGPSTGMLLEVEATARLVKTPGTGHLTITGVVDEEELGGGGRVMKRKSMARSSIDNVLTTLNDMLDTPLDHYDIHVNFPGGTPVDGPSAGVSMAVAIYSAVKGFLVDNFVAMTGEVSIHGGVRPVGGIVPKIEAAMAAGATRVIIPAENRTDRLKSISGVEIIYAEHLDDVLKNAILTDQVEPVRLSPSLGTISVTGSITAQGGA